MALASGTRLGPYEATPDWRGRDGGGVPGAGSTHQHIDLARLQLAKDKL